MTIEALEPAWAPGDPLASSGGVYMIRALMAILDDVNRAEPDEYDAKEIWPPYWGGGMSWCPHPDHDELHDAPRWLLPEQPPTPGRKPPQ